MASWRATDVGTRGSARRVGEPLTLSRVLLIAFGLWCLMYLRAFAREHGQAVQARLRLADLAGTLGLVVEDGALVGRWSGIPVRVDQRVARRMVRPAATFTTIRLELARCGIAVAWGPLEFRHWCGRDRILTGDARFDSTFVVGGEEAVATAVLGEAGRRALAHLCMLGGSVVSGQLTVVHGGSMLESGASLRGKLDRAVSAARFLVLGERTVARALADNVRWDPCPGVRVRNLEVLVWHAPQSVEAREALQFALGCGVPELVMAAARLRQTPEALLAVLTLAKTGPLGSRTAVLTHLLDHYPLASMREVVDQALCDHGSGQQALVVRRIGLLVACRDPDVLALATLSVAAQDALGRLVLGADIGLAVASARVLGVGGSPRVLAQLRQASRGRRRNGALKEAAYVAVLSIRERSGGEAGALSVAVDSAVAGALSPLPGSWIGVLGLLDRSDDPTSGLDGVPLRSAEGS